VAGVSLPAGFHQGIKVFSHFFPPGCSLVSRGELAGLLDMKILTPVYCRPGAKILSYFFRFQSLFNNEGSDDFDEFQSRSASRKVTGA
jgi:hypothetical protein